MRLRIKVTCRSRAFGLLASAQTRLTGCFSRDEKTRYGGQDRSGLISTLETPRWPVGKLSRRVSRAMKLSISALLIHLFRHRQRSLRGSICRAANFPSADLMATGVVMIKAKRERCWVSQRDIFAKVNERV